jgi:small subunit ribosomal protein S21e
VQLNIGHLDENGVFTGDYSTVALAGSVRLGGDADSAIDHTWKKMSAESGQVYGIPDVRRHE